MSKRENTAEKLLWYKKAKSQVARAKKHKQSVKASALDLKRVCSISLSGNYKTLKQYARHAERRQQRKASGCLYVRRLDELSERELISVARQLIAQMTAENPGVMHKLPRRRHTFSSQELFDMLSSGSEKERWLVISYATAQVGKLQLLVDENLLVY